MVEPDGPVEPVLRQDLEHGRIDDAEPADLDQRRAERLSIVEDVNIVRAAELHLAVEGAKLRFVHERGRPLVLRWLDPVVLSAVDNDVQSDDAVGDRRPVEIAAMRAGRQRADHRLPARAAESLKTPRPAEEIVVEGGLAHDVGETAGDLAFAEVELSVELVDALAGFDMDQ